MLEKFDLNSLLEAIHFIAITKATIILLVGFFVAKFLSNLVTRFNFANMTNHGQILLKRAIFYGIMILMSMSALRELGFDLSVILGAAGILMHVSVEIDRLFRFNPIVYFGLKRSSISVLSEQI